MSARLLACLQSLRRNARSHLFSLLLAALVLLGGHFWQTRHVPSGPAPAFTASAVSLQPDARLSLAQWQAAHPGQPVALNFWAEWCPICKLEQGNISRVAEDWPVLTVAMQSGDAAAVRRELGRRGLSWATVVDPQAEVAARYGVRSVPALVVIDSQGRIQASSMGYTTTLGMRARLWWAKWRGRF